MRREELFCELLEKYDRIAIAGGPKTGKTTLAETALRLKGHAVVHTDDWMHHLWSGVPHLLLNACQHSGDSRFIIEGIQVGRALRKGVQLGTPLNVQCVVWLDTEHETLTARQRGMAKGCLKIFEEWMGNQPPPVPVHFIDR